MSAYLYHKTNFSFAGCLYSIALDSFFAMGIILNMKKGANKKYLNINSCRNALNNAFLVLKFIFHIAITF